MRRFTLLLLAATALSLGGETASAADLPVVRKAPAPVPPPPLYSWSGFYIGGHIGVAASRNSIGNLQTFDEPFCSIDGFSFFFLDEPGKCDGGSHIGLGLLGGGTAGFNIQSGQVVFGVEGTYS